MAQQPALRLSGSLTNLAVASRTFAGPRYTLDLSRVRLRAEGSIAAGLALDVQYDNEVLLGSYLRTAQFMQQKEAPVRPYWDAEANYHESRDAYGRHRLYRAWATLSVRNVDLRIGRQRIAWGTGRFWSPLDIVNPVEPLALEREERPGVDAVLVEAKLGPVSRLSAVYAPRRDGAAADRAAQWHGNVAGIDFSWMAGRLAGQAVLGMDVATQLGQAGLRAEATSQRLQGRASFRRLMLGLDYAFANTLTLSAEGFYNGAGVRDTASQDPAAPSAAPALGEATRYVGLYAGYEVTPLLKWTQHLVINADDGSRALDARLVWAARPDMELTLGVQGFAGRAGSEFARRPGTWLARLQWFF
jgi:hypothetical protein